MLLVGRDRPARVPNHELGIQQNLPGLVRKRAAHEFDEGFCCDTSFLIAILSNGCQPRSRVPSQNDIVKSNNRYIPGNLVSQGFQATDCADGSHVVSANESGGVSVRAHDFDGHPLSRFECVFAGPNPFWVGLKTELLRSEGCSA